MFFVYIIYSDKLDRFYVGFSANPELRLIKHNRDSKGFTAKGRPWILVYSQPFSQKNEALKREKQIKSWKSRKKIIQLIQAGSEHPD
jgi:putative endonuclease